MIPTSFTPLGAGFSSSLDYVTQGIVAGHDGYFNGPGKSHSTDTLIWYDWTGNGNHTLDLASEGFTGPLDWRLSGLMIRSTYLLKQTVAFPQIWNTLTKGMTYTLEVRSARMSASGVKWKLSNYWGRPNVPFEWILGINSDVAGYVSVSLGGGLQRYSTESSAGALIPGYSDYENNTFAWSVDNGVYSCYVNGVFIGLLNGGNVIYTGNIGGDISANPLVRFTLGSRTGVNELDDPDTFTCYDTNAFFQAIRLYDRPLTQEELAFNAATDLRRFGKVV